MNNAPLPESPKKAPVNLLMFCDDPDGDTGFGRVARELLRHWLRSGAVGRAEIWAIGYEGYPWGNEKMKGWRDAVERVPASSYLCPAAFADPNLSRGAQWMAGKAREGFTHLFALQNPEHVAMLGAHLKAAGQPPRAFAKSVAYLPCDAQPLAGVVEALRDQGWSARVPFTPSGQKLLDTVNMPVPHGVDAESFFRAPEGLDREALRAEVLGAEAAGQIRGKSLYAMVCRPDERKGVVEALQIMARMERDQPGQHALYLHMAPGLPVDRMLGQLGIAGKANVLTGGGYFSATGQPMGGDELLRKIYWMSDLYLVTSRGEGWCLPLTEAAACGTPVAAPSWGATGDILQAKDLGAPHLVLPSVAGQKMADAAGIFRPMVHVGHAAEKLMRLRSAGPEDVLSPAAKEPALADGWGAAWGWDRVAARLAGHF